ncbi:TIGR04255 family protein [Reyranella sp.]|uniref:TIGR04255 family protein n=1 Tax=Reyranella sp. TaxID=1929291 RepID=UPI00263448A6|nr:TIGR04255 family protein [Reyranella sp.]HQS18887.1 TIGR04255 family protein [Reyranella sp.]HQT12800.1 TIGR04255 family protein [Reyranella sp.]
MSAASPSGLPSFERPPVTEVVLSLQFDMLSELKNAHIGYLWSRFRDRYPKVQEQPSLEPSFETFGTPPMAQQPSFRFEQFIGVPATRYWFETADDTGLCQVQNDRIIHNWRKREGDYPRYEYVRAELEKDLNTFEEFLVAEDLGSLRFNQIEVSYINTIDLPGTDNPHGAVEQVISTWTRLDGVGRDLEDIAFRARFLMSKDGVPNARLHVSLAPALETTTLNRVVRLDMTYRGKPESNDRSSAMKMLDEGRAAIVVAFADMTTPEMHNHWGRTDVQR